MTLMIQKSFAGIGALLFASSISAMAEEQSFKIRFVAEMAGQPFACEQEYSNLGTQKVPVKGSDFRVYVSEFELLKNDGTRVPLNLDQDGTWQYRNVALLDFENGTANCSNGTPELRDFVSGSAAKGIYKGLSFKVGVPFELNHNDPTLAPSPLNLTSMFWTWQGGYKFVKIDLSVVGAAMKSGDASHAPSMAAVNDKQRSLVHSPIFSIHLGSTMCQSASRTTAPTACANGNRIQVNFEAFDPEKNVIVFDPAPVLAGSNLQMNTSETSPGCMSFPNDPECNTIMPKLGFSYAGYAAEAQAFIRSR